MSWSFVAKDKREQALGGQTSHRMFAAAGIAVIGEAGSDARGELEDAGSGPQQQRLSTGGHATAVEAGDDLETTCQRGRNDPQSRFFSLATSAFPAYPRFIRVETLCPTSLQPRPIRSSGSMTDRCTVPALGEATPCDGAMRAEDARSPKGALVIGTLVIG